MTSKATAAANPSGDADNGQDPTMEEILASIRRIISDDDDEDDKPVQPAAAEAPAQDDMDDDVLELTQLVAPEEEEPAAVLDDFAPAEPAPAIDTDDADDLAMEMELSSPIDEAPAPLPEAAKATTLSKEDLVSTTTASAAATAMAELTRSLSSRHMAVGSGVTLEEIVREMLRPMLKDWLDAHLTGIIERVVQQEIERLAKQALGN